jgi:hypothetical protein
MHAQLGGGRQRGPGKHCNHDESDFCVTHQLSPGSTHYEELHWGNNGWAELELLRCSSHSSSSLACKYLIYQCLQFFTGKKQQEKFTGWEGFAR